MRTTAFLRSSLASSEGCIRSRSAACLLCVELLVAPLLSLAPMTETVCLPTVSEIPLFVWLELPPRKSVVSQQSTIVCADSPYRALSCESDWRMTETPMFLERTTAMVRSKSGSLPMFANSSRTRWTGVGSDPPCTLRARSQSRFVACQTRSARRNEKVPFVSDVVAKTATLRPGSPMRSIPRSSPERTRRISSPPSGASLALQLMIIDLRVLPAATLKAR